MSSESAAGEPPEGVVIGGRYLLAELLGAGGSASVYAADDLHPDAAHLSPRVALKMLHPHLCADESARTAFLREADRAAGLRHPNLVTVRGAGLHDAGGVIMPWIAMDLVSGPTLREHVIDGGPLTPGAALALADGLLAGLAAAHAAGVVHRDISPQNLVFPAGDDPLDPRTVRLLDFGLADDSGRTTVGSDILLAQPGAGGIVGNAHYMSPEQAAGRPVRVASDLYQVGAVLYFALTGQPPYPRADTAAVLEAHRHAPPPVPSALVPAARPLDRLITRAMTKTPARRFRDAGEFRSALLSADAALELATRRAAPHSPDAAPAADAAPGLEHHDDSGTGATRILPDAPGPDAALTRATLDYLSTGMAPDSAIPPRPRGPLTAAAIALVILIGGSLTLGAMASQSQAEASAPPPAPVETTPTPTETPAPAPTVPAPAPVEDDQVAVPTLFGSLADVSSALQQAGLVLGTVTTREAPDPADTFLSQYPAGGTPVAPGTSIDVVVASGYNVVPAVAGMDVATATALLQSAGFVVADRAAASGTVTLTRPAAGVVVRVGITVHLSIDTPTPTPAPTPTPQRTDDTTGGSS